MKKLDDIIFIIQARKDSSRVGNKMLRPFADSTLIDIAIQKVEESIVPWDNFYLSVADDELVAKANQYQANIFHRSKESLVEPIIMEKIFEWQKLDFKYFVIINACNPILSVDTIDSFIEYFTEFRHRGLFGVVKRQTFAYDSQGNMINEYLGAEKYKRVLETKFVEPYYEAAHSLYAGTMEDLRNGIYMGKFDGSGPEFYQIPEKEAFDIDYPWQFWLAENMYKEIK